MKKFNIKSLIVKHSAKPKSKLKVLLVEPPFKPKYPPLALMKISALHKLRGDEVTYAKGFCGSLPLRDYDQVYITSLFTYDGDEAINCINQYKAGCRNADIHLGGIFCSLMPEYVKKMTGINPHVGIWMDAELTPPDYGLVHRGFWSEYSYVYTSRGCPRKCGFCAVKILEPEPFINPRWKEHISEKLPRVMIHDNNITAADFSHFQSVVSHLKSIGKEVTFDNGFDCRLFTEDHCRLLANLNLHSVRFAFDNQSADGHLQRAVKMCLKHGIPASTILVYILFNYKDTPEDALWRASETAKLGVRPYAMQYTPLNTTQSFSYFNGKWDRELCKDYTDYINNARLVNTIPFDEWRKKYRNTFRSFQKSFFKHHHSTKRGGWY